jgi:hypothetical protein
MKISFVTIHDIAEIVRQTPYRPAVQRGTVPSRILYIICTFAFLG